MRQGILAVLVTLSLAHNILQLTDEKVPLRLESATTMALGNSTCLQPLSSFTLSGWFKADSSVPQQLLSIATPSLFLTFNIDAARQLVVSIGILGEADVPLQARLGKRDWQHMTFSVSAQGVSLSVWDGQGEATLSTAKLPQSTALLDLSKATTTLGGSALTYFLDLTVLPITLAPSDAHLMSPFPAALPSHSLSTAVAQCQAEGLVAPQQKYQDSDLYSSWSWKFGLNMFGWDYEDFGGMFSTVKIVFDLNDVMGDPDMEVYLYHILSENEYLGESKKEGPDSLTFDWNTPRFKDGMEWTDTFRVYIEGKSWFNWWSLYCTVYSTEWYRLSNGQRLGTYQTVQKVSNTGSVLLAVAIFSLVGLGVCLVYRKKGKKQMSQEALLEKLLVAH